MGDSEKSKEELLAELAILRSRYRALLSPLKEGNGSPHTDSDFKGLVDAAGEGLLVVDRDGRFLYANREAARISGYTEEQLMRRRLHDLVPPNELPAVLERLARRIGGRELPRRYESVLLHRDGSQIPLEVSGTRVIWRGEPVSMTMIRDITKRKRSEEELGRIVEEKSVLFREVNHRVKNNLAAIIGVLLKEQRRAEEEGNTAYLPVLRSLVGRVMGLATVHGMLSAVEWRPLRITDICAQVISAAVQSVPHPSRIRVRITPSPLLVSNEQAQHLALVVNELAANSVKHALDREGGIQIKISIAGSGSKIRLVYHDDGPGYPEALVSGDFSAANVGFDLVRGIVVKSLRGELALTNDQGAMAAITFEQQVAPQDPGSTSSAEA
jgi:PAS domain S-box-containing protein